jgi:hypothetical protein
MNPASALLVPTWSISENDDGLIVFAEYGSYGGPDDTPPTPPTPHRRILTSTDPNRMVWTVRDFQSSYKHIHFYQINPYNNQVHLIGLGDFIEHLSQTYPDPPGPYEPGLFISTDGGATFAPNNLLRALAGPFGGRFNAPCTATFFPHQRAFITNDTYGEYGFWWGAGKSGWSSIDLQLPLTRVFPPYNDFYVTRQGRGYAVTPWSAIAARDRNEAYGCARSDSYPMPGIVCRFDYDNGQVNGQAIAAFWDYSPPPCYMSTSNGNVVPRSAKFVFNDARGGIRIPRLVT